MRTKNKMKDFEAKFEELWEVEEEYFTKESEKNMVQHRGTSRKLIKRIFQISFVEVQQVYRYRAKMKI
jgi:hypothetical protein